MRQTGWPTLTVVATGIAYFTLLLPATHALGSDASILLTRWVGLGLLASMLLLRPVGILPLRRAHAFDLIAVAFIVLAFTSALYSSDPAMTLQRAGSVAILYAAVFWTVWMAADLAGDERIADMLLIVVSAFFIVGIFAGFVTEDAWMRGRFRGVMENPNAIGLLVVIFLPLAFAKLLRSRSIWWALVICICLASVALSGSRNGVITGAFGMCFLLFRRRYWKAFVAAAAFGLFAYLVFPPDEQAAASASLAEMVRIGGDASTFAKAGGRLEAWQVAMPLIGEKLGMGYGFGTEEKAFEGITFLMHRGEYIHNSYLGLTYQLGLAGSVLFFVPLLFLIVRRFFSPRPSLQTAAYEAVLAGGLVAAFFESWIYSVGNAFALPFWVCVAFVVRDSLMRKQQEPVPETVPAA